MPRILIADDEPDLIAMLAARFRSLGFEVLEARDGAEAFEVAKAEVPDIAILDVMMPELNGFQVCRKIKEDPRLQHIPVIILTAKSGEADKFWGKEVGADKYLNKPINPAYVVLQVEDLLEKLSK